MIKVLLIEDEPLMAEMYFDKLSIADFAVEQANTAEAALEIIKKEKMDLVLLDMLLPIENGIFFLENLRAMKTEIAKVPVIVLSNYDEPDTRKKATELGIEAYLLKTDFTPQTLVKRIKRICFDVGKCAVDN